MLNIESGVNRIDPKQARMRKRLSVALALPLRSGMEVIGDGLKRAEEAARNGSGTVIVWNHFSKRDGFDAGNIVAKSDVWSDRPSVFPVGLHQKSRVFPMLNKFAGYTYPYIVTEDTIKDEKYKDHMLNEGMGEFVKESQSALSQGGTVSVAFQGGRKEYLNLDDDKVTIGKLIISMKREKITNFGILIVGLGDAKIMDYSRKKSRGLRPFRKTEIKVGPYFMLDELMNHPEVGGKIRNVDPFIRRQFVPLVPKAYLKAPEVRN